MWLIVTSITTRQPKHLKVIALNFLSHKTYKNTPASQE